MQNVELRNLHQLHVFIVAAESLSFSRAGERLLVSQPAISRHIKEMETAIGAPLFDRQGRRLALTEIGHLLYQKAKRVEEAVDEMENAVANTGGELAGLLKLGSSTAWEYLLPGLMGGFQAEHPKVALELIVRNTERIVEFMLQSQVHLGFVGADPDSGDLEAIPMGDDEVVIIAPREHPLATGKPIAPSSLEGVPFVQREAATATAQLSAQYLESLGVSPRTVMELGSHEAIKGAVRAGVGLGMVTRQAVDLELATGAIAQVRLQAPPCTRRIYALRKRSRLFSPVQQAFLSYVAVHLQQTEAAPR